MNVLDTPSKSIEVILGESQTTALPVVVAFDDSGSIGSTDTETDGTTAVTAVAGPGDGRARQVLEISVFNADNVEHGVTLRLNNGTTTRKIFKAILQVNESLRYSANGGWQIFDENGTPRTVNQAVDQAAVLAIGVSSIDEDLASDTVLSDLAGLSCAIQENETWVYTADLDVGALLSTTGAKVAVTVPAGATVDIQATLIGAVAATAKTITLISTTSGATLDFTAANLASQTNARIQIMIRVANDDTAGVVAVQGAQSTTSLTNLTFRAGSRLVGHRVVA